ncbi:MAG TPA: chemotaxis protein CheW [Longimicrobiaceae bacterium]|nr:chemotaxis protein CheW [Longimicrobiaceae bacterium]
MQILLFELDDRLFGLPVGSVAEVLRAVLITPLPGAPAAVEGAIDVRGTVVPVLDVRARFELPPRPVRVSDRLIVVERGDGRAALRVGKVREVEEIEPEAVDAGTPFVAGVATLPDGLVLIHDPETFLSSAESAELARVLPDALPASDDAG